MSPKTVMPLLLSTIVTVVLVSGVARAQQNIILAQAQTPQQHLEEEKKKKALEQQHIQQQQQQKALEQQKVQQEQARRQAEEKAKQQKGAEEQRKAHDAAQQKAAEDQRKAHDAAQHKADEQRKAQEAAQHKAQEEAAKLKADQAKSQQLQQPQRKTEQPPHQQPHQTAVQQQQPRQQQPLARPAPSAAGQKDKAERDAHRVERERLIAKQQQTAAAERSQAAIAERLRLQNERMRAIASQRQQSVDRHGQTVIKEPGNRTIIQAGGRAFVQHDETARFKVFGGNPQSRQAPNGNTISTFNRPGGVRIEIEVDSYGRPIRRVRYLPDGRRFVLFQNRGIAIGAGLALGALIIAIERPRIIIPREEYIVDAGYASEDDIYSALQAGPVEPLDRGYALEEVLATVALRERMRSINIDSINFEFGSSDVGPDQAVLLETVAAVMRDMASENPGEVFLVEGHTDAVGSDIDNLSLSDRRAQAVADVLAQQFSVPAENLVTQGYGKQFLLIPTDEPERRNRRVVVRRITPLLQTDDQFASGDRGPR
jgi:outer membrane protein OmpA-like peptidoglycan-associated protein